MSTWPSNNYLSDAALLLDLSESPALRQLLERTPSYEYKRTLIRRNIVKLVVYLKSQVLHKHVSQPAYTIDSALSDTGGQVGLWLGLSVLTIFEIVEMLAQLAYLSVAKLRERKLRILGRGSLTTSLTSLGKLPSRGCESFDVGMS
uniref:Peroxisomal membrane protein PEX16 n=1 Tax=Macrostomum lignano TaxID=282301 RepID=A0A1I8HRY5_9PLAT